MYRELHACLWNPCLLLVGKLAATLIYPLAPPLPRQLFASNRTHSPASMRVSTLPIQNVRFNLIGRRSTGSCLAPGESM
ncbi:hypothetical protein FB567DRAFT_20380 [Paraphoma chrysanthemicola]|uniref:Uncharacterized protein n=1 Tax=Paraphoma chrysanthemicola TaxID=798071 RepID=A0A8K0W4A2_9PLEO|nr:hypothetical protein FB567DRAFT_20380 [Paraphoma chrysanthemicola]